MRNTSVTSIVLVGCAVHAVVATAASSPAGFHDLFSNLLAAEGQEYLTLRAQVLELGQSIRPELDRIVASKTATWQERALARALLARTAVNTEHPLDDLEAMLKTATLPQWADWARPRHLYYGTEEPFGSPLYIQKIGLVAFFNPEWSAVTVELFWKGLISNADSRRSVLDRLKASTWHADHELAVGLAQTVLGRATDLETSQLAVQAMLAHVGPARQDGRPVQDAAGIINWLVSLANDPQRDLELRATIVEHLGGTGEPAVVEPVLKFLRQSDPRLQSAAIRSCGALVRHLAPNNLQRSQIIEALARVLDAPGIPDSLVRDTFFALGSTNAALYPEAAKQAAAVLEAHAPKTTDQALKSHVEQRIRYLRNRSTQPAVRPESQPSNLRAVGRPLRLSTATRPSGVELRAATVDSQPSTRPTE